MPRSLKEWIGRTEDSPVPPRVKLRVFERAGGRCHISGRKIATGEPWDIDHVIALCNWTGDGHGNRETNLAPALRDKHKEKTKADVAEKATAYRKRRGHLGLKKKSSRPLPGGKHDKYKRTINHGTVLR